MPWLWLEEPGFWLAELDPSWLLAPPPTGSATLLKPPLATSLAPPRPPLPRKAVVAALSRSRISASLRRSAGSGDGSSASYTLTEHGVTQEAS